MLEEIRIRGLGVIDDAALVLHPGLTVVTGETGAGKTLVLQGLGLLCGGRLDSGLLRPGAERSSVEGRLVLAEGSDAAKRAVEAGAVLDEGGPGRSELLVSRVVSADGRSRCQAGGASVPVGVLADLAASLVVVHGQHDQQRLSRPAEQRDLLDRYGGADVAGPLERYRAAYDAWRSTSAALAELVAAQQARAAEAEELREGVLAVAAVEPVPGEEAEIAAEVARLAHADGLRSAAASAHDLLGEDHSPQPRDALTTIGEAQAALKALDGVDARLDELTQRLAEAGYLVADLVTDLSAYLGDLEVDPDRLAALQERQSALARLTKRYAPDSAGLLAWLSEASGRLFELDGDDERVAEMSARVTTLDGELRKLAAELSAARRAAATTLSDAVTTELAALAMPNATFRVEVEPVESGFTRDGVDVVSLTLAAHAGAAPRPLARSASGGELSRIMLALEVVLAAADPVPTMVFDEVDAGVGGKAAVEVGRRLARLARSHQVIVVTHLPQVAAFADSHLRVSKSDDGTVTRSDVAVLDDGERLQELSRMLAGLEGSELARGHAEELLAAAAASKGD